MTTDQVMQRARERLAECERGLQELVQQAAASGDYDTVMRLATIARSVGQWAASPDQAKAAVPADAAGGGGVGGRKKLPTGYPRFVRRGGDLIKIGWSKREKKEYQHKAPESALRAIVEALSRAGAGGKVVRAEELLPLKDESTGEDVPSYQMYVCLAWMRELGVVSQDGRQGYSLAKAGALQDEVAGAWTNLAQLS